MNGFLEWAERYCRLFGLSTEADLDAITALDRVFELAGFTIRELEEATDWLSLHSPSLRHWEHRVAIRDCILQRRAKQSQQLSDQAERQGAICPRCSNTGFVIVPDPRSVSDGVWDGVSTLGRRYTAAVTCSCSLGERKHQSTTTELAGREKPPTIQRLVDYEQLNPDWTEQVRRKHREDVAASYADRLAARAESTHSASAIERVLKKLVRE
jgi:hypothetical protein